ncbi:MAG TPA: hypothetical protein VG406_26520 [Isosphaeraceae bacterium]|jgi:hypothetical protein|nr:hypothetical protein [Isosphaeraceae bacterium]
MKPHAPPPGRPSVEDLAARVAAELPRREPPRPRRDPVPDRPDGSHVGPRGRTDWALLLELWDAEPGLGLKVYARRYRQRLGRDVDDSSIRHYLRKFGRREPSQARRRKPLPERN